VPAREHPRGSGELILIVDSEDASLAATQRDLEASGYRTVAAADGPRGFALFASMHDDIALIVANPCVPMMDGVTFIAAVRRIDTVLGVVATDGSDGAAPADAATHVLARPFTSGALLSTVRRALDAR
jgi:CheY-like chemotaxis protein